MIMKAQLLFHRCLQNMQEIGTSDEIMKSRIFFSLELPNKRIDDLFVDIKLTAGDSYENGAIEVGSPQGKEIGNINYPAFRDAVEAYYRHLIGKSGGSINVKGGSAFFANNSIAKPMAVNITIDTDSGGW